MPNNWSPNPYHNRHLNAVMTMDCSLKGRSTWQICLQEDLTCNLLGPCLSSTFFTFHTLWGDFYILFSTEMLSLLTTALDKKFLRVGGINKFSRNVCTCLQFAYFHCLLLHLSSWSNSLIRQVLLKINYCFCKGDVWGWQGSIACFIFGTLDTWQYHKI